MHTVRTRLVWTALAAAVGCLSAASASAQTERSFVPVTDAMLQNPDSGDWLMWRRTLNGWGYSPLEEIDARLIQPYYTKRLAEAAGMPLSLAFDGADVVVRAIAAASEGTAPLAQAG